MTTIVTENKVYKFSELSANAKERAKQDYYDGMENDDSCDQFKVSANDIMSDEEYSELSDSNDYKYFKNGDYAGNY